MILKYHFTSFYPEYYVFNYKHFRFAKLCIQQCIFSKTSNIVYKTLVTSNILLHKIELFFSVVETTYIS